MIKYFTFSAESFALDPAIEAILRSRNAIYMDFGSSAYVRSEQVPLIISDLLAARVNLESAQVAAPPIEENEQLRKQLESRIKDNDALIAKLDSKDTDISSLKNRIENLQAENLSLTALPAAANDAKTLQGGGRERAQSYEKLHKEFQELRSQSIEAIASLKVLEDENDELRTQLEALRPREKAVAS